MSEHHFGCGNGHVSEVIAKRIDRIARKLGASFMTYREPDGSRRYWFSCRNRGAPFDGATAKAVLDAVAASGIVLPGAAR